MREHQHSMQAENFWQEQHDIMRHVYDVGVAEYVQTLPDVEQAFELSDRCVRCIDEGTVGGVHVTGSGILLGLDKTARALADAGVEGVYSHAECGAAGLYAKQSSLDVSRSDEYGKEFAQQLAAKLGVPYQGHIAVKDLHRPSGLHVARVAYYDATGNFDPSRVEGLPSRFVISRKYLTPDYALEEVKVGIDIALGAHGFGKLVTDTQPFVLVPVGSGEQLSADALTQELRAVVESYGGRVTVSGFDATQAQGQVA